MTLRSLRKARADISWVACPLLLSCFRDGMSCGCKMSTKSVVTESRVSLQRIAMDESQRLGIPARASEVVKDLGVLSTAGRGRCIRLRRRTAFRRARRLQ
eukprot:5606113-Pyramimonas_sp.AAC.1